MNLIEKYLAKAAGKEHVAPGQDLTCKVSFVAAHDVTAPIAIRMFREIGVKKVFDPSRVALTMYTPPPRRRPAPMFGRWTTSPRNSAFPCISAVKALSTS